MASTFFCPADLNKMSRRKSKWDIPADAVADSNGGPSKSAAEEAKEKAAKLTAMLAAKGKLAKNTGSLLPVVKTVIITPQPLPKLEKEQDLIIAEVEINDSPARTILCKGFTQDEVSRYSGAAISTKGRYMDAEEKKLQTEGVRPLYLCVQGTSQYKVDIAVRRVKEIMNSTDIYGKSQSEQTPSQTRWSPYQPPVPVLNTNYPPAPVLNTNYPPIPVLNTNYPPIPVLNTNYPPTPPSSLPMTHGTATQALPTGMHFVQDKVFVGLDSTCSSDFNLKDKLLGPVGSYFQHIATETGAKVFLRGKGSGFLEPTSGKEAFEALHIYISHPKLDGLSAARKLVENLIATVNIEYRNFEQMKRAHQAGHPPQPGYPQPMPGYMHPMGYQPRPGIPQPPAGYPQPPGPPGAPPGMYYGPPPPGYPQAPPPPHGQVMPPHGYPAPPQPGPPLPRGHSSNGMPTSYPGYATPQGPLPPGVTYPPRPGGPPGVLSGPETQGPPNSAPTVQSPQEREPSDYNYRHRHPPVTPPGPQPEPLKRRFKEVPRSEVIQESLPRNIQESPRIPGPSSLGCHQDPKAPPKHKEEKLMPPPSLLKGFMPPPKPLLKPPMMMSNTKDFKKPLGSTKPFSMPPPPKDIIIQEALKKPDPPGNIRKHGLSLTSETSASKKTKKEQSNTKVSPTAIMSLVAYDSDGDSSEEEEEQVSNTSPQNSRSSSQAKTQRLPFWALGK